MALSSHDSLSNEYSVADLIYRRKYIYIYMYIFLSFFPPFVYLVKIIS